ncbi:MAG: hypothetical protein SWO11_15190 [Thermodesulfobacteriota bacterium]|nr:hypothetical protein [Thermodesulfobacteriota bacterium]
MDESDGLAYIKNKWVLVDLERLKKTLDVYEKAKKLMDEEGFCLTDALCLQLRPEK